MSIADISTDIQQQKKERLTTSLSMYLKPAHQQGVFAELGSP